LKRYLNNDTDTLRVIMSFNPFSLLQDIMKVI